MYSAEQQSAEEILQEAESKGQTLFEEFVIQHPDVSRIYSHSVNTLRIHTVNNGKEIRSFFKPMLRIGCDNSVIDANLNVGSYRMLLNDDGMVEMPIYMSKRFQYKKAERHHNTGVSFKDVKIPYVKEAVDVAIEAAKYFPEVPYIGWDIAISEKGPVVIEGNAVSSCFKIYQLMNYMYKGAGLRKEIDEMISFGLTREKDPVPTKEGLVRQAKRCEKMATVYLWGGIGEFIEEDVVQRLKQVYPKKYTEEYCDKLNRRAGKHVRGFDCSGLIKNYIMGGLANFEYNSKYDLNSYMMLEQSKRSGDITTLPEEPGLCLFMPGHVGIYVGNQEVIESTSNPKFGDGVVRTKLSDRQWTHWFLCPGIEE